MIELLRNITFISLTFQLRWVKIEDDIQLFQWVRSLHLDDEIENPDP